MKKSFLKRIKVKLKLFRSSLRTLTRTLLLILLVLILIYTLIISFPELFENITNFLIELPKNVLYSIIGLFEYIIAILISTIMQEQVISKIYQIVYLLFLFYIVYHILNKIFKIADWAQPSTLPLSKNKTRIIAFIKIHRLYPLFTEHEKRKEKIDELEGQKKEIKRKINMVSSVIHGYEKRETVLEKYANKYPPLVSETEKNLLLCWRLNENGKKDDLERQLGDKQIDIEREKLHLENANHEAHDIIIKVVNYCYYKIYKKCVWFKNKTINYLKKLYSTLYEDLKGAISKITRDIISAFTKLI